LEVQARPGLPVAPEVVAGACSEQSPAAALAEQWSLEAAARAAALGSGVLARRPVEEAQESVRERPAAEAEESPT
jgi:hypothetical protein